MSLGFVIVLIMLVGASWSDLRTRRVPNRYWLPFVAIAALLWLSDPGDQPLLQAAGAAAMTLLAYLLWRVGTFGGADAKGLMVFAWMWPGVPDVFAAQTVPVLDTLVNATLVAIAVPLLFLLLNVIRGDFAFPAALLGTRIPLARARARHVWPMQRLDLAADTTARETPLAPPVAPPVPGEHPPPSAVPPPGAGGPPAGSPPAGPPPAGPPPAGPPPGTAGSPPHLRRAGRGGHAAPPTLRWRFWHRPGEDLGQTYRGLEEAGVERVWVTPKIPFMVPLTAAAVATWAWGNVVLRLLAPG